MHSSLSRLASSSMVVISWRIAHPSPRKMGGRPARGMLAGPMTTSPMGPHMNKIPPAAGAAGRDDPGTWLRVHAMSLESIPGQAQAELLLVIDVAPAVLQSSAPGPLETAQCAPLVLGPHAASVLLRALLDAGVQPTPPAGEQTPFAFPH